MIIQIKIIWQRDRDSDNPDQEDLDSDLIGDVCDPCNNLVYIPGNVNGDANEGNEPVIDVIDMNGK